MKINNDQKFPLKILIVDDEANIRKTLSICLESEEHEVQAVGGFDEALQEISRQVFDVVFLDLKLGSADGLDLIAPFLAQAPWMKIVVITAFASIDTAVEAMRRGATDYIPKPFSAKQIKIIAKKLGELKALEQRVDALQEEMERLNPETDFSSSSTYMRRAIDTARQVAESEAIVLLRGESGTGKTVLARAIHQWSRRSGKPFMEISCPALPADLLEAELFGHVKGAFTGAVRDNPGRVSLGEGGTLFLDEIADMPLHLQAKLLRFIQERQYERVGDSISRRADVRIIAATNRDLEQLITEGKFREDLYYRINVVQIALPPLRERIEDIEEIATHMLVFFSRNNNKKIIGFTKEAISALKKHNWQGNLRELRNAIERSVIMTRQVRIGVEYLPGVESPVQRQPVHGDLTDLKTIEKIHIQRVIANTKSLQEAAGALGIDQATLWRKRKEYDL